MKFISLFSMFSIGLFAVAQTTITFQDHSYQENAHYVYHLVESANSGGEGENQIWDFSKLSVLEVMDGEMNVEKYAVRNDLFPTGNICIVEFGNRFVFESSEKELVQLGYVSKNEKIVVEYLKPMVKLKFPLYYSDSFSGQVELKYQKTGVFKSGTYLVKADAYGTVVLPNQTILNNALRVKSVTSYNEINGGSQMQTSYRWYVQNERVPVMVLQQTKHTAKNGRVTSTQKAAYKGLSNKSAQLSNSVDFSIHPNPARTFIDVSFSSLENGTVSVDLFGMDGKLVDHVFQGYLSHGNQKVNYLINEERISPGSYVVKIHTPTKSLTQQLIIR